MSFATPSDDNSVEPFATDPSAPDEPSSRSVVYATTTHQDVTVGLTNMLHSLTLLNGPIVDDQCTRKVPVSQICEFIRTITKALDYIGPAPKQDESIYRMIVPPESCDATSLSRAAATLDMTKIRLLLASSRLSLSDLNSYAQLILAEQDEYRRAHRRSLPIDSSAAGIYTPTEDEANRFVDDNPDIYIKFASDLQIEDYFHLLKAFTHESATDGKTSSKLLSMIGRYALKLTTYRMCYMNGESYAIAKERIFKFLEEDRLFEQALSLDIPKYIILGPENYNSDKEIVLQTLYAIFGLYYSVQGESGIIHLNKYVKWFDASA